MYKDFRLLFLSSAAIAGDNHRPRDCQRPAFRCEALDMPLLMVYLPRRQSQIQIRNLIFAHQCLAHQLHPVFLESRHDATPIHARYILTSLPHLHPSQSQSDPFAQFSMANTVIYCNLHDCYFPTPPATRTRPDTVILDRLDALALRRSSLILPFLSSTVPHCLHRRPDGSSRHSP